MTNSSLHIIIPTFGRIKEINKRIPHYHSLVNEFERLCITYIDNFTDQSFASYDFSCYMHPRINIEINSCNIGGVKNIKKALRASHADWTWVVPDDATVTKHALQIFFEAQFLNEDYIFALPQSQQFDRSTSSLKFVKVGKFLEVELYSASWLGSNIFRTSVLSKYDRELDVGGALSFAHLGVVFKYFQQTSAARPISVITNAITIDGTIVSRYKWLPGAFIKYLRLYETYFGCRARSRHLSNLLKDNNICNTLYKCIPYQSESLRLSDILLLYSKKDFSTYGIVVVILFFKYIAGPILKLIFIRLNIIPQFIFDFIPIMKRIKNNIVKFDNMSETF